MTAGRSFTEDELHAYADGALDAATAAEVEAWLQRNPDAAAEVAAWRAQAQALHATFDPVLTERVPEGIAAQLAARPGRLGLAAPWVRAAAAAALFAAGSGAGWIAHEAFEPPGEERFVEHAVGAHLVFASERRHAVEVRADTQEQHLVHWLSARLGRQFQPPTLTAAGFALYGGRLVADDGGPAAQYMYQSADGKRLTLYVRRRRDVKETAFRFADEHGMSAFYWIDGPLAYALVGPLPREHMLHIARLVYQQCEAQEHKPGPRS